MAFSATSTACAEGIDDLHFSSDGQNLAFINWRKSGEAIPFKSVTGYTSLALEVIELQTKKSKKIIVDDILDCIDWSEDGKHLIISKQVGTKKQLYLLNISSKSLTSLNTPHTPVIYVSLLSRDKRHMAFIGETLSHPGEVYFSSVENFNPKKITSVNSDINLSAIKSHSIKWKSFDGVEIEGILTYPYEYREGNKVPLIVSIHGGPPSADSEKFIGGNWGGYSPAFFASEGYATLTVNYRGSIGYGSSFTKSNYEDLGGGDFEDVMSGIDHLVDQGIADPKQLFMSGYSYGGFMSAWAIGNTNRFKAAMVGAGLIDWISQTSTMDVPMFVKTFFKHFYWNDYKNYESKSPLTYINNLSTPTLILQGSQDVRVPPSQAQQLYQALIELGIQTRLVLYRGEGHGFNNPINTADAMKEMLRWFKTYEKQ